MPSSSKRPVRKRAPPKRKQPEAVTPDSRASRSAAKRRKTNRSVLKEPNSDEGRQVEPVLSEDDTDDAMSAEMQELADAVIPNLAVSSDFVVAVRDWTNKNIEDRHGNIVSAYAKICGRDWTYYVKSPTVNIGRPPDGSSRQSTTLESSPALQADNSNMVHIDLGPSKLVSRLHAKLFFDQEDSKWHVNVNGRNGVKVNDQLIRQGQQRAINSGDVMEIAGTQMMFVAAEGQAVIHPMFLENIQSTSLGYEPTQGIDHPAEAPSEGLLQGVDTSPSLAHSAARTSGNGQPLIAPAPPDFLRPTTPTRSPKKLGKPGSALKQSPGYGRGIVMESNENIDYRSSATRDIKPNWSYSTMISQAIMSTDEQVLCLDGIYKWIMANFSYYRYSNVNWQNSIRHNLSLSTAFIKVPRNKDDPGKGSNWTIVPEKKAELVAALEKQMKRSGVRRSSAPSSPATRDPPLRTRLNFGQPYGSENNDELKESPTNCSPPLSSYPPTAQESYTPSRGPQLAPYATQPPLPTFSDDPSPLGARRPPGRTARANGSSPTLTSGAWLQDYHPSSIMTPAPRQHNLNLPLPNTVKLPTSHMPDSSPAPFWKWTDQAGSTPAKWPGEISPLKRGGGTTLHLQSSSPPPLAAANGLESPTGGRGFLLSSMRGGYEADDEDGGFDLTKGFPKISSYHHHRSNAVAGNMVS